MSRRPIPGLVRVTVNLHGDDIKGARKLAKTARVGYQTLLRTWIAERVRAEAGLTSPPTTR